MKEPVFMDKLGFCLQLSMKSAVFMDNRTDGVFEATCHPRLGGASEGGGGRRNTPSVRFMCILVDYYKIRYRAFAFVVELLVVIWMVDDACLLCP